MLGQKIKFCTGHVAGGVVQNKGYNKKEYIKYKVDFVVTFIFSKLHVAGIG